MRKERPIIMSPPMAHATHYGFKTETRRTKGLERINENPEVYELAGNIKHADCRVFYLSHKETRDEVLVRCPYGEVGDILWVRENVLVPPIVTGRMLRDGADTWPKYDYPADLTANEIEDYKEMGWKMKPSIHMVREACRTELKLTSIKLQRLNDIADKSAIAEGVEKGKCATGEMFYKSYDVKLFCFESPVTSFKTLWESINGSGSWAANPWVWALKFERIEIPQ